MSETSGITIDEMQETELQQLWAVVQQYEAEAQRFEAEKQQHRAEARRFEAAAQRFEARITQDMEILVHREARITRLETVTKEQMALKDARIKQLEAEVQQLKAEVAAVNRTGRN